MQLKITINCYVKYFKINKLMIMEFT